jgi:hypothetical protein
MLSTSPCYALKLVNKPTVLIVDLDLYRGMGLCPIV